MHRPGSRIPQTAWRSAFLVHRDGGRVAPSGVVIGSDRRERLLERRFDVKLLSSEDPFRNYGEIAARYLKFFTYLTGTPCCEVSTAANTVPFNFYGPYDHLSRFRLARWMFQNEQLDTPGDLSAIEVPQELVRLQNQLVTALRGAASSTYIWDSNVFRSFVEEVRYFNRLGLISGTDAEKIRGELHRVLDDAEDFCVKRALPNGNKMEVYLSNISFEAAYSYMEKPGFQAAFSGSVRSISWRRRTRVSAGYRKIGYGRSNAIRL